MMLFTIVPVNVVWLHFMFFLHKLLWNVLTGRSLSCCREKRKFGTSESQYFSWSIHREQRSGEKTSVIETKLLLLWSFPAESPPREYSRSSYLSISFYLPTYLSRSSCHTTIPSSSLNLGTILLSVLISLQNSFGSLHTSICLLLLFFLFLSFLRALSSNSWSSVSLSLPNSHCGWLIPLVPSSISISPSCTLSLHFIYAHQSITFLLYLIPLSIYYFYSLITSLSPETELIIYCAL